MIVDQPEVGFYKTRLVKGGPWVPVRIFMGVTPDPDFPENSMDRPAIIQATIGGEPHSDPIQLWIWCAGDPIDEAEYKWRMADKAWCVQFANQEPAANPRRPIVVRDTKPVF